MIRVSSNRDVKPGAILFIKNEFIVELYPQVGYTPAFIISVDRGGYVNLLTCSGIVELPAILILMDVVEIDLIGYENLR